MFKNFNKNKYNSKFGTTQGLTLVELLVVVSIFMIVTGVTIFNYNSFDSSVSTQNLADDIALTIRRAQGYAVGVRAFGPESKGGYGIQFTKDNSSTSPKDGSDTSFVLFADINNNQKYENNPNVECGTFGDAVDECMELLTINSSDKIDEIYLDDVALNQTDVVDIVFKRPNPEPVFYLNQDVSSSVSFKIKVSNTNNLDNLVSRYITISNTGQISVSVK